jgi:5-methylcytosine-specific restriction endonuclease McrA
VRISKQRHAPLNLLLKPMNFEDAIRLHEAARKVPKESLFSRRVKALGFVDYGEYLNSELWAEARKRYFASALPKTCMGCGTNRITLHHRTYIRLGCERPTDLIPLCWDCHKKVHNTLRDGNAQLNATHKALRTLTGLSRRATVRKFKPWVKTR